jgi:rubrerythrin
MVKFLQQEVAKVQDPKKEVINVLLKNMSKDYPERSHKQVHASDVTKEDWCPRQFALMDKLKMERPPRFIPAGLKATFDVGNLTSDLMREEWLGDGSVGHWRCIYCFHLHELTAKPKQCVACGSKQYKYVETHFVDHEIDVSGSIDVLLDLKGPKLIPGEIKIIKADMFDELVAPLAEHRIRTQLYLRLIEKAANKWSPYVHQHRAKVIYVSRGFGKKSAEHGHIIPFKEFDVKRDDSAVEPYLHKPRQLKAYRKQNGPLPDAVCDNPLCSTAKKCPVRKHCFEQ